MASGQVSDARGDEVQRRAAAASGACQLSCRWRARSRSVTSFGFALPLRPFITWPTRKPNVASLPARILRHRVGVAPRATPRTIGSSSCDLVGDLRQALGRDDLVGRRGPMSYIFSKTSLAIDAADRALARRARSARRAPPASAAPARSSTPRSFSVRSSSPITQLLAAFGLPRRRARSPRSSRPAPRVCVSSAGVVLRQPVLPRRTAGAARRAARASSRASRRDARRVDDERRQVGLGEVAVVVRLFLAAHRVASCPAAASHSRVSCTTRPPCSSTSICRSISYSMRLLRDSGTS